MPTINAAHWHLLLNHIPIVGVPLVAVVLVWGLARAQEALVRIALVGAVAMAAAAWLADTTGEPAEHEIKDAKYAWVDRRLIHEHEEAAEKAGLAAYLTGALALGTLVLARGGKPPHRGAASAVLLGLGITTALLTWTAWEGGKIRHDEFGLTPGATTAPPPQMGGERQE